MSATLHVREHHSLAQLLEPALTMACPHCEVYAQMAAQGTPSWQWLMTHRPSRIGVSALCPACRRPVFLVSGAVEYGNDEITILGGWEPLVKPAEPFDLDLLPQSLVDPVTEALACYRDGHWHAFVLLCHRITHLCAEHLGDGGRLQLFNAVTQAAGLAGIDSALTRLCRDLLFDLDEKGPLPSLSPAVAKVLLALLRDLLHEAFVRRGRLVRAMPRRAES